MSCNFTVGWHRKVLGFPVTVTGLVDRRQLKPISDGGGKVPYRVTGGIGRDLVVHVKPVCPARAVVLHL